MPPLTEKESLKVRDFPAASLMRPSGSIGGVRCNICRGRIPWVLPYCRVCKSFTRTRAHELVLYAVAALFAFLLIDQFFRVFNFYGS